MIFLVMMIVPFDLGLMAGADLSSVPANQYKESGAKCKRILSTVDKKSASSLRCIYVTTNMQHCCIYATIMTVILCNDISNLGVYIAAYAPDLHLRMFSIT